MTEKQQQYFWKKLDPTGNYKDSTTHHMFNVTGDLTQWDSGHKRACNSHGRDTFRRPNWSSIRDTILSKVYIHRADWKKKNTTRTQHTGMLLWTRDFGKVLEEEEVGLKLVSKSQQYMNTWRWGCGEEWGIPQEENQQWTSGREHWVNWCNWILCWPDWVSGVCAGVYWKAGSIPL